MNTLIQQLNDILSDWCKMFDPLHAVPLTLSQNVKGEVFLIGKQVFLFPDAVLEKALFDAETIRFSFDFDRFFVIKICWPEEESPAISGVFFGYGNADEATF